MKKVVRKLAIVLVSISMAATAFAQNYDPVIKNGRVMDVETMVDAVANVGNKDGKIAVITKEAITGKEAIDATGHVVTAGFVDTHFHWTLPMDYKLALRDGATTVLDLEMGTLGTYMERWYKEREGNNQGQGFESTQGRQSRPADPLRAAGERAI